MKRNYRITYSPKGIEPIVVEGLATSKNNAARLAFKIMINQGYIKAQPKTTNDGWYENTTVEVVPEKEPEEDE